MQAAQERNVIISMTLYHQRYRKHITVDNARAWAKWLAQRYKAMPNIVWSMTVKPVLMAEGAYEAGSEYGFDVTPLWVRRQAFYSFLAGAHHTYGHNDSWPVLPTWKQALDAPGAVQLGILKKAFLDRAEWWNLVPDQSVFASGGNTNGTVLNLAARHQDGKWVMVYLASKASVSVNLDKIKGADNAQAFWIDPRNGKTVSTGTYPTTGSKPFATPDGCADALLILEALGG